MDDFNVIYRNYGHWDIYQKSNRTFRIRGGPGRYYIIDEREYAPGRDSRQLVKEFKTLQACMGCICDELMFELIIAEGQTPQIIEKWNV